MTAPADTNPLREALEEIANHPEKQDDGHSSYSVGWAFWNVQRIAKAALSTAPVARDEKIARILNDHFYTGEPGQHDAIKAATAALASEPVATADADLPTAQDVRGILSAPAPAGREDLAWNVERIILRRLRENRIDGYTKEMSEEIATAVTPQGDRTTASAPALPAPRDLRCVDQVTGRWRDRTPDEIAKIAAASQRDGAADHVLVPREPTTAMLAAGQKAWNDDPQKRSSTLYRAMVEASTLPRADGGAK